MYYNEESLITIPESDYARRKKIYEKMGDGACLLRNFAKAIDYYKKMLEAVEKLPYNVKDLSAAYTSLGQTYKDTKEYNKAMNYFKKDLELQCNQPQDIIENYLNMAEILELSGKIYDEIEEYYLKAIDQATKSNLIKYQEKAITKLIKVQQKFGETEKMVKFQKQRDDLGLDLSDNSDSDKEDQIENIPNIGEELNLSDISDISDEEKPQTSNLRSRRGVGIKKFKQNAKGEWPLHTACIAGREKHVLTLLEQGHPVNCRDNAGWMPLHEACNYGHLEIVKLLLQYKANVNDRGGSECGGQTPLHDACGNGHLLVVQLLLENGASPILKNNEKQTALDILLAWKEKCGLDSEYQSLFDNIVEKMTTILKKTANSPVPSTSNINKAYLTPKRSIKKSPASSLKKNSPLSQLAPPHKRVLQFDDGNSSNEFGEATRQYR